MPCRLRKDKLFVPKCPSCFSNGRCYEQSLSAFERAGYRLGIAGALGSMGSVAYTEADYPLARIYYQRALAIFRELGQQKESQAVFCISGISPIFKKTSDWLVLSWMKA